MGIGENIREMRKQMKMTQVELSRLSGIKQATISAIENGRNAPTTPTLELLARAMRCSVSQLINEVMEAKPESNEMEERLMDIFRLLNEAGQAAILASAEALLEIPAMRKEGYTSSMA